MRPNEDRCSNMNHSRSNAPVRFCPKCGESVNKKAGASSCDEIKHGQRRKEQSFFCFDCGKKLR